MNKANTISVNLKFIKSSLFNAKCYDEFMLIFTNYANKYLNNFTHFMKNKNKDGIRLGHRLILLNLSIEYIYQSRGYNQEDAGAAFPDLMDELNYLIFCLA